MRVVAFTGAGISRESGLSTFRDSDGLWEGHRVEEVATVDAWRRDPERVLRFYNERRRALLAAEPNAAHRALAELERDHAVTIVTQNVDDLHERAGSSNVVHLHGELLKARSVLDDETLYDCRGDIAIGDLAPDGGQLRPHVVWFGEVVEGLMEAERACLLAEAMLVVGTSLVVQPAASLVGFTRARRIWLVDPNPPDVEDWLGDRVEAIAEPATVGVPIAIARLRDWAGG